MKERKGTGRKDEEKFLWRGDRKKFSGKVTEEGEDGKMDNHDDGEEENMKKGME